MQFFSNNNHNQSGHGLWCSETLENKTNSSPLSAHVENKVLTGRKYTVIHSNFPTQLVREKKNPPISPSIHKCT